jgi:hypothetical protein
VQKLEKRVNQYNIRALELAARDRYVQQWRLIQARFVDDPSNAVWRRGPAAQGQPGAEDLRIALRLIVPSLAAFCRCNRNDSPPHEQAGQTKRHGPGAGWTVPSG